MTDITQCPQCGTHFNITPEQRNAHKGMVRCGRCQTVFNAVENIYTPPQQLDLPLALDDIADATGLFSVYDPNADNYGSVTISAEAAARKSNDFSHIPDVFIAQRYKPASRKQTILLAIGSLVFALVLALQTVYFYRVDIAARVQGAKPVMLKICAVLNCSLPLPQKIDLITIESSELEADPTLDNIITLHALLRSRAPYAMAYPSIELTLTDTQDNAVARRSFTPGEYLPSTTDINIGFPANRESAIKLHINTTDLKPAGYRLFLFYPQ
jgi:predicted Zn finger-like uncharacterized protein